MRFKNGVEQQDTRWSVNPTQVLKPAVERTSLHACCSDRSPVLQATLNAARSVKLKGEVTKGRMVAA